MLYYIQKAALWLTISIYNPAKSQRCSEFRSGLGKYNAGLVVHKRIKKARFSIYQPKRAFA